jgi:EAL domain-containing protein (putative c-di-GMP-specific phosphodiesterase class I)
LTDKIFYLGLRDEYIRGSWFIWLYIIVCGYMIFAVVYLFKFRILFNHKQFVSLLMTFPLLIIAVVVQLFLPSFPVEMFATAIALLFIAVMIKPPEEFINNSTGLNNFNAYVEDMKRGFMIERPCRLIMVNVSNFMSLKSMLGYDRMAKLLRRIAGVLIDTNSKYGLHAELYYIDTGKFRIMVKPRFYGQVEAAANEINELFKTSLGIGETDINVLAYVCVTDCTSDVSDFETLMAFENDLMKKQFTGDVVHASDIIRKQRYDILLNIDSILDEAFAKNQFSVYYQPIYSVNENRFNSAEALLRLKSEKYGFIPPDIFIPAAEGSGAIHRIGDFVLEEVCKFVSSEEFKELGIDYIEVNLSVVQCMQKDLAKNVIATLKKYNVSPDKINLEITETAAAYSEQIMDANIQQLTQAGIKLSLDDFGTGYSNMERIASLPLHIVKLDKTFSNLEDSKNLMIVLKNTIRMIKDMDMKIVVEGVETQELVKRFSDFKCDYIQGYYFSRPIPKDEFVSFVAGHVE